MRDGQLVMRVHRSGTVTELQQVAPEPPALRLRPVNRESFCMADGDDELLVTLLELDSGRPGYLFAGRAARRAG